MSPRMVPETAAEVLYFAHKYALPAVVSYASQILEMPLTPATCLQVYCDSKLRPRIGRGAVLRYARMALHDPEVIKRIPYECMVDILSADNLQMSESDVLCVAVTWGEGNMDTLKRLAEEERHRAADANEMTAGPGATASVEGDSSSMTDGSQSVKLIEDKVYPLSAKAKSEYSKPLANTVSDFGLLMKPLMKHVRLCHLELKDLVTFCDTKNLVSERDLLDLYASKGFSLANLTPPADLSVARFWRPRRRPNVNFGATERSSILTEGAEMTFAILMDSVPCIRGGLRLELLYDSKRDGMSASTWHKNVDNRGPTVTIFHTSEGILVMCFLGTWTSSNMYKSAKGSFMAGMTHEGRNLVKFLPVNNSHIYDSNSYGPTFGSGHDCYVSGNMSINCAQSTYRQHDPLFTSLSFQTYFKPMTLIPLHIETWLILNKVHL